MNTKKRWLESVIATASGPVPALPWQRQNRLVHAKASGDPQPQIAMTAADTLR